MRVALALTMTRDISGWRIFVSVCASGFCTSMTLTTIGNTTYALSRFWRRRRDESTRPTPNPILIRRRTQPIA